MNRRQAGLVGVLFASVLAACQAAAPDYRVHHTWLDGRIAAPTSVLLLPAEVAVSRMSLDGIEPVPELSRRAGTDLAQLLASALPAQGLALVTMPQLDAPEQALVEEHVLLFEAACNATFPMPAGVPYGSEDGDLWWPKVARFDLGLGPGLSFLAQRTGCSTGVFLAGLALESTGGRRAWSVFGSLLGVHEQTSLSRLFLGFVDLESGAILWTGMHVDTGDWADSADSLTEREELSAILAGLLADYPGLDEYREAIQPE